MMRVLLSLTIAVTTLVASGCGTTKPARFFQLAPLEASGTPSAGRGVSIGIGPVELPEMLDRPQIVTRLGPHERRMAEFARWAEPLDQGIARVLAANLVTLLGIEHVSVGHPVSSRPTTHSVSIEIVRFDADENGRCVLTALWSVSASEQPGSDTTRRTHYEASVDSDGPEAVVAAMSRNLADLSRAIAGAIEAGGG